MTRLRLAGAAALLVACSAAGAHANDFPTAARVDYVLGCMAANGQGPEQLMRCSCSVDVIAEMMPYEEYEEVETIKRMQLVPGERSAVFRDPAWMQDRMEKFRQAQVQADLQCF